EYHHGELEVFDGPGSSISHVLQVNVLYDDDYLNMTDGENAPRDTSFVVERLADLSAEAAAFTPFNGLQRTDTYEGVQQIASQIHDFTQQLQQSGQQSLGTGAEVDFVLTGSGLDGGKFVNGERVDEVPLLDDFLPDRGLAKPAEDPDDTQSSVESIGG